MRSGVAPVLPTESSIVVSPTPLTRHLGLVEYQPVFEAMQDFTARRQPDTADEFWVLQHPPVFTQGLAGKPEHILQLTPIPIVQTDRGGQVTYHGPGQRVAYVMLNLKRRRPDVRAYVAALEEWIIRTLAAFNVRGERREDRVGVWVRRPDKGEGYEDKIAAIGIRVRHWVTLHGVALNIEPDLSHFSGIVPCGVHENRYGVTSLADLGHIVSMAEVDVAMRAAFEELFGPTVRAQAAAATGAAS